MKLNELSEIFNEIIRIAKEEDSEIFFPEIVDTPSGERQRSDSELFDHEYIIQKQGNCCDSYYGFIFYPIGDKYLKVGFSI